MNFLSHGIPYLNQPFVLAGTAVPDWLSVVDRKVRARCRLAQPYLEADDEPLRDVAWGITHHHRDDAWFHATRAFAETNLLFALELRELLPGDEGFRPTFVGHILIEMILDRLWIAEDRKWADSYYASLASVDPVLVGKCVERVVGRPVAMLPDVIRRFIQSRFLYDYQQTGTLLVRLNQVMRRVKLADLPPAVGNWLPRAVTIVERRRVELLTPMNTTSPFPLPD
jgi:hypothetical protein